MGNIDMSPKDSRSSAARIVTAACAGVCASLAPYAVLVTAYHQVGNEIYDTLSPAIVIASSSILGAMVFTLVSRRRPLWTHGLLYGAFAAILGAIAWGFIRSGYSSYSSSSAMVVLGVSLLSGIAGASLGSLLAGPFGSESGRSKRGRLQAWHVGLLALTVELAAVVALVLLEA